MRTGIPKTKKAAVDSSILLCAIHPRYDVHLDCDYCYVEFTVPRVTTISMESSHTHPSSRAIPNDSALQNVSKTYPLKEQTHLPHIDNHPNQRSTTVYKEKRVYVKWYRYCSDVVVVVTADESLPRNDDDDTQ